MNELNYVYYGGKSLAEFDLYITNAGIYQTPQRDYEKISVPGRSGDLVLENDRYLNVDHVYPAVIASDFHRNFAALRAYLMSKKGYSRLEDTFCMDEFYMAIFKGIENVHVSQDGQIGTFNLVFDRKPQRYLKSGEREYLGEIAEWESSGTLMMRQTLEIKNPTGYTAEPIIKLYFVGTVPIQRTTSPYGNWYTIENTLYDPNPVVIDCETCEATAGHDNWNDNIIVTPDFPKFEPIDEYVRFYVSENKPEQLNWPQYFSVIPRWWTI